MQRLAATLAFTLALAAPAAAETRDVSGFTAVSAEDRFDVEIVTGEAYRVQVTGPDAHRVRTRLDGGTLRIRDANRPWFGENPDLDARIRITAPHLGRIAASRGAEIEATLNGSCDDLDLSAAMGGSTELTGARCDAISASASMGGTMRLAGECRTLSVSASMGAVIEGEDMQCQTVDASASMGGEVRAFASRAYNASAGMGGDINFAGDAPSREVSTSLGGSVSDR